MSGPTPGPWRAEHDERDGCWDIRDSDGDWIAEEIDEEAHARLIAAAPELLDALKDARRTLSLCDHPSGQGSALEAMCEGKPIVRIIDAAIAKAESR